MRKSELMELIGKNVRHYWTERKMTQDELSNIIGKNGCDFKAGRGIGCKGASLLQGLYDRFF